MNTSCKKDRAAALAAWALVTVNFMVITPVAAQGAYPSKPVRIVVPYPPGGAVDQVTRRIAQKLTEQTGQSFFVENKAGATGTIGALQVAKSAPDGYTLMTNDTTYSILPHVFNKLPFDHERDLLPVAAFNFAPMAVVVAADSRFKTLGELVAFAKANPGKLNYGTGGAGTTPHFVDRGAGERSEDRGHARALQGRRRGDAGPAVGHHRFPDRIDARHHGPGQGRQGAPARHQRRQEARRAARTCRPLPKPASRTTASSTTPACGRPRARRPAVTQRLQKEIAAAMASPDVQQFSADLGSVPTVVVGDPLTKMLKDNTQLWGKVAAGAKVEKQ